MGPDTSPPAAALAPPTGGEEEASDGRLAARFAPRTDQSKFANPAVERRPTHPKTLGDVRNAPGTARERSHDDPPLLFDERQDVIGALQLPWLGLSRPSWPRDPDLIVNRCDGVIIWLIIGPRDGGNFDCHGEGAVVAELERGEPNPDYPSGIKEHLAGWAGLAWQLGDERKSRGGVATATRTHRVREQTPC